MTWGDLNRKGNAVDDNFDRQGPRTQGNYAKLMLFASRTQSVSPLLTLVGNLTLQPWVSKNLDANEKVGLTGASGLRAYSSGDISGDLGGLLNLEARYRLSGWTFEGSSAQAVLFYDLAYVQLDHTVWQIPANAAERNSFYASGVGVGLDITKSDAFSLKASYAFKVNDNINDYSTVELDSEGQRSAGRWMLQLLARF
jgi:hemolysin activation/secretion protein